MMRRALVALAAWLATGACGPSENAPLQGHAPALVPPQAPLQSAVRLRIAVPGRTDRHFEIAPEACPIASGPSEGCPFGLAWVAGERVVAQLRLDWLRAHFDTSLGPLDPTAGAGDPLDPGAVESQASEALYTGADSTSVATMARPLALAPGVTGLIVDQQGGFEHVRHAHFLFAVADDRLAEVWRHVESAGSPTWSSTAIVPTGPGRQGVMLVAGALGPEAGGSDEVEARTLRWDPAAATVVVADEVPVFAAVLGRFAGEPEARAAREARPDCLADFWMLPAERLALPGDPEGVVLAALGASEAGARRRIEEARTCASGLAGSVATLRQPTPDAGADPHTKRPRNDQD